MEIQLFVRLIKRNVALILICIISCLSVSTYLTVTTTPIYQARVKLFVSTPSSFFDVNSLSIGSNFGQQRVKSYAQIVNSPLNLDPVIKALGLEESAPELAKSITAIAPTDTVIIEIVVSDPIPARAVYIADAVGKQFELTVASVEVGSGESSPISARVVETATTPKSPVLPRKKLNFLGGLFFGLSLGVALSLLRLALENRVKNEGDLEGKKLLAAVMFEPGVSDDILGSISDTFSFRAESFRLLRANILNLVSGETSSKPKKPKTILITSAHSAEGKTTTCISLSQSLATAGFKVLLVEADLRRPTIRKVLSGYVKDTSGKNYGFVDVLNKTCTPKSAIKLTSSKGLSVVTSGRLPSNPAELLASSLSRIEFAKLISGFDFVIIDSPPLLAVNDSLTLAPFCDHTILVLKAGSTRIPHYRRCTTLLEGVNIPISGVILNMIPEAKAGEDYGYGYGIKYGYRRRTNKYGQYLTEYIPQEEYFSRDIE